MDFSNRDSGTLAPGSRLGHWSQMVDSKSSIPITLPDDCQKLIRKSRYEMTSGTSDLTSEFQRDFIVFVGLYEIFSSVIATDRRFRVHICERRIFQKVFKISF